MASTRSAIQPATTPLVCGEHGDHTGEVIGCCHICGLLLCRGHANHLPTRGMGGLRRLHEFGVVNQHEAAPLVCGDHAVFGARAGVPGVLPIVQPRENLLRKWWIQIQTALRPRRSARRQPPPPHSRRG